jgi:aldose 1-epimerase
MRETVAISAGDLYAEIVPSLGAGLARFDLTCGGKRQPIFRPWPERGSDDPNSLAAYVLVPWSNRISGGGFEVGGKFHQLEPNFPPEPFPIHGNGWTSEWTLVESGRDRAVFEFASDGPGPFCYLARLSYGLTSEALTLQLEVTNRAETTFPYGFGFHPWLPRTPDTRVQAHAETIWLEDDYHLPTRKIPVTERPDWNFDSVRPLPNSWINNGFDGWDGRAHIKWPSRNLSLAIDASERLGTYLLYSPSREATFFCFEPVSHVVDAHNLLGGPAANGLVFLATNETAEISCRFSPSSIAGL